ncbi:hypothetical protein RvY_17178-2 [Ramazzottius varieornatus]|uniref:Uncharacterized protein n=1 Tax=Ramazzottius varieornatus TaxID=947166 RepID=A0A1D1W184_RAMVA|nr:hypothetical protein RvY_17178-2 [Ramazzottius varieornatus]
MSNFLTEEVQRRSMLNGLGSVQVFLGATNSTRTVPYQRYAFLEHRKRILVLRHLDRSPFATDRLTCFLLSFGS